MKITKKSLYTMIPLILAPFTFFLFGPIEMVIRNAIGLWFTWLDVLPIVLITFVVSFLILCLIGLMLPEKVRHYYIAFIWGLGFALYAQGNLMPVDYGVLEGLPVAWEEYTIWAIVNTAIWFVLLAAPMAAVHFRQEISQKAMVYVTCVLLLIQIGTGVFMIAQPSPQRDVRLIVTDKYLYTVSENKNIVVLILDSFDSTRFMPALLDEEPELTELLDGFVFFDNTLGMFPKTRGALPHILTGRPFLNEMPFWDYLDMAWSEAKIYPMLKERNFSTFIHTDSLYISPQAIRYVDNVHEVGWIMDDTMGMANSLFNFVGTRYFPHVLKAPIWIYSLDFFNQHRISIDHGAGFTTDSSEFYNMLMQDGFNIIPNRNVFSVIHLMGPRDSIDRNVQPVAQDSVPLLDSARGSLQIALDYLSHLKEMDIDDNTLLIVTADHGWGQLNQRPLLLVRDPAHRSPFTISSVPISFKNLMPMLEAYVAGEQTAVDYLLSAALDNDIRVYFYYDHQEVRDSRAINLPSIREYIFIGGTDLTNAQFTGIIHESGNVFQPQIYNLGDTLHFARNDYRFNNPGRFFSRGLSWSDSEQTWQSQHELLFSAVLDKPVTNDLRLDMTFQVFWYGEGQTVRLYAGEQFIDEAFFANLGWGHHWQNAAFTIPGEAINGVNLALRFEFPDAVRSIDVFENNEDVRFLAIGLREMTISEVQDWR